LHHVSHLIFNFVPSELLSVKIELLYIYINSQSSEKIQLDLNWIINFAPCVLFNF